MHQQQSLCDLIAGGRAPCVGLMSQLIDVVADGRQSTEQVCIGVGRTGRRFTPMMSCRTSGSFFKPVTSACRHRWAYSVALSRRVIVLYGFICSSSQRAGSVFLLLAAFVDWGTVWPASRSAQ